MSSFLSVLEKKERNTGLEQHEGGVNENESQTFH